MASRIKLGVIWLLLLLLVFDHGSAEIDNDEETKAKAFLDRYNKEKPKRSYLNNEASWKYATNLTKYNQQKKLEASSAIDIYILEVQKKASVFNVSKLSYDSARQIKFIVASGSSKNTSKLDELAKIKATMQGIYSKGKVYDPVTKTNLSLSPDLVKIMANSESYEWLLFAWDGWRVVTGPQIRSYYTQFVKLSNEGARENGWKDTGEWWRSWYEVDNLSEIAEELWNSLRDLYQELHAYVRHRLREKHPQVMKGEPIPAHILGNMWAQSWTNIYKHVEPYKNKTSLDVTRNLENKKYTPLKMVKLAESFFTSLGLEKLPDSFYDKSLIEKPKGRQVVCHASAWDFKIKKDVRIKQCTTITHDYLVTTHHELGHIQYYLQYWDQPDKYRTGANPGFHEAVGDTLSLSVDTPQHLKKIGLLDSYESDYETDINAMMKMGLRKIAFLPFGYLMDQWRWKVFEGKITEADYNAKWWELRTKYQGIKPPSNRTEHYFDPGAKYHIPNNTPYIRYFMSYVLQFQFHKAACKAAGFTGPLHQCSIYESKEAGDKLGAMLKMGKSKPWPEALKAMTGSDKLSVEALKEYFKPLDLWLRKRRCDLSYPIGWEGSPRPSYDPCVVPTTVKPSNRSSTSTRIVATLVTFIGIAMSTLTYLL